MPTYDYVCRECGHEFSCFQNMSDAHLETCPKCAKKALRRKIGTGAGIIFKGSGFYCTDYAHNSSSPSAAKGGAKESPASASPAAEAPKKTHTVKN